MADRAYSFAVIHPVSGHTAAGQQAIGARWADHKTPRMTLAEATAHAARLEEEKKKQLTE